MNLKHEEMILNKILYLGNKSLKEIQANTFKQVEAFKEEANKYKEIQENTNK